MDVSFILSLDEVFTLITLSGRQTDSGARFAKEALTGAALCDLSGLVEKKLAGRVGSEIELAPITDMMADALALSDSAELDDSVWTIRSPWVVLRCETYPYKERHFKITPLGIGSREQDAH